MASLPNQMAFKSHHEADHAQSLYRDIAPENTYSMESTYSL